MTEDAFLLHDLPGMVSQETADVKAYLKTLTTRELIKMADQSGIDIPPDLDRPFIIQELLDNEYGETPPEEPPEEDPYMEMEQMPRHHITFLEVLPRDPQWVYVFWEIKAQDREYFEQSPRFEGYALQCLEYREGAPAESFTVAVGTGDNSWYLGFPPGGGNFRVELRVKGFDLSLAVSRPFALPRFLDDSGEAFPLVRLSGAADFSVLRIPDRVPCFRR